IRAVRDPTPPVRLERLEDQLRMLGRPDARKDLGYTTLLIYDEGRALIAPKLPAKHRFLLPNTIRLRTLVLCIRQAMDGKLELLTELQMVLDGVRAEPEDASAAVLDLPPLVTDRTGLGRATRGVILGVEVEDHLLAT